MKLFKIPFWLIICISVPLIYLFLVNPLFFGQLFSSITSPGKGTVEKEVHRFLEDRYNKPFEVLTLNGTNLHGTFMGRVLSIDDSVVFNVFKGQSSESQNDYPLKEWAKPVIESVIKNNEVVYEVEYKAPSLQFTNREADYWDTNFIKKPQELSLKINFMYINKMSRDQIFNIIKKFKTLKIGKIYLVLYLANKPPDMVLLNELGFEEYYLNNKTRFDETCEILNPDILDDANLFQIGNTCLN